MLLYACRDTSVDTFGEQFWLNWPAVQEIHLRKFVPCASLINSEKKTNIFQPQPFNTDSMCRDASLLSLGGIWTGGWQKKIQWAHPVVHMCFVEAWRKELHFPQWGTTGMNQDSQLSLWPCQCRAGLPSSSTVSCTDKQQHPQSPSAWKCWCFWQSLWGLVSGTKVTPSESVGTTFSG